MRSGNENIHMLTMDGRQRLRIDMTDWRNNKYYVEYDHFRVGPESRNYTLECLGSSIANTGQYELEVGRNIEDIVIAADIDIIGMVITCAFLLIYFDYSVATPCECSGRFFAPPGIYLLYIK